MIYDRMDNRRHSGVDNNRVDNFDRKVYASLAWMIYGRGSRIAGWLHCGVPG
jgi:hypothetical protein